MSTRSSDKPAQNHGLLIMAANSIGRPEDIPARSLDALRSSDLLIFEEDRGARQALKQAGIHRSYLRFSEHRQAEAIDEAQLYLREGKTVCYMSDQGLPNIADPGQDLLELAYRLNAKIMVIPGPSSISAALAACPFLKTGYRYVGFLSREAADRSRELQELKSEKKPFVILDTPYRLKVLLEACVESLGAQRKAMLALDISGPKEQYHLMPLGKLADLTFNDEKLNFVLVIDGHRRT